MSAVSHILADVHSLSIRPGAKGACPFCHHATFAVKGDDSLGKCFHPACGRVITSGQDNASYGTSLPRVLAALYDDFHQELHRLATGQLNAYTYLRDERDLHPQVIADALLGVVPSGYDLALHFQPVLDEAQKTLTNLQGKKDRRAIRQRERAEQRLQDLKEAQQKLHDCLAHRAGWLSFFYTDAAHQYVALRLRQPYAKQFVSFKPGIAGLFGRELFTPYQHPAHQDLNQFLLVVEGEFNVLQLQSLTVRYEEATGQQLGYVNACAVGSVTLADANTIKRVAQHPVVIYDHDVNAAGFELVKTIQRVMPVEAGTTPDVDSDLDAYLRDFGSDPVTAWQAVQALIASRQAYGRIYAGTGEEFFSYPVAGRQKVFVPRLLGEAVMGRYTYRYTASQLWVYRGGVYLPCGETTLRADAQALLGDERREARLYETLRYVQVARRLDDDQPPDVQHINCINGRLEWQTRTLNPHTPAVFTVVQLPLEYDEQALCPAFDDYLRTSFDSDVAQLIEEILGWCLIPDNRYEKAVMLTGAGENGKSVFLDLIGYLLGEANIANVALQDLEENRFRAAELFGKIANVFADLDARGLQSSSMFKTLVTGDWVTAERKYGHPFRFRSYAKLLFSANRIPPSRDRSYAFYRRWIIVPFTRTFNGQDGNPAPDKALRQKLRTELPGIFNRALTGLERLTSTGAFTEPKSVLEAMAAYIRNNENVRAFVEECAVLDVTGTIEKQAFYGVYKNWCASHGERAVSQRDLRSDLEKLVPQLDEWRPDRYAKWRWLGLTWSAEADAYFPPELHVSTP